MVNDPVLKADALRRPLVEQHAIGAAPDPEVGGSLEYASFGIISAFLQFLFKCRAVGIGREIEFRRQRGTRPGYIGRCYPSFGIDIKRIAERLDEKRSPGIGRDGVLGEIDHAGIAAGGAGSRKPDGVAQDGIGFEKSRTPVEGVSEEE